MCEKMKNRPSLLAAVLVSAAAVVAVLALLILVPTSPALDVDDPLVLMVLGNGEVDAWGDPVGLPVTAYAVFIAVGAALGIAFTAVFSHLRGRCWAEGIALALVSGACALVCSHLLFCAVRWSYVINDLGRTAAFLVEFWQGGYTMYGAILGGLLGAFLFAKARRLPVVETLDILMPGMLVLIAAGRFGEQFTMQGVASYRAAEGLSVLPFTPVGEWGDPELLVYAYECIFALIALAAVIAVLAFRMPTGRAAETGLAIVSIAQIMMESWRGDELIKFGFVCLNMVCAAVVMAVIFVLRIVRIVRREGWKPWTIARIPLLLLAVGAVVIVEFGFDGKFGIRLANTQLYAIQAVAIAALAASVLIGDGLAMKKQEAVG